MHLTDPNGPLADRMREVVIPPKPYSTDPKLATKLAAKYGICMYPVYEYAPEYARTWHNIPTAQATVRWMAVAFFGGYVAGDRAGFLGELYVDPMDTYDSLAEAVCNAVLKVRA
jgi:hypothetical protein